MHRMKCGKAAGQSLLEFAIALPLLMFILLGIAMFGQLWTQQIVLNNAVREGARVGAMCAPDSQIRQVVQDRCSSLYDIAHNLQVFIYPPEGDPSRVAGAPLTVEAHYDAYVAVPFYGFNNPKRMVVKSTFRLACPTNVGGGAGGGTGGSGSTGGASGGTSGGGGDTGSGSSSDDSSSSSDSSTSTSSGSGSGE